MVKIYRGPMDPSWDRDSIQLYNTVFLKCALPNLGGIALFSSLFWRDVRYTPSLAALQAL